MIILPSGPEFSNFLTVRLATVGLTIECLGAALPIAFARMANTLALNSDKYCRNAAGQPTLRMAHYSQMTLFLYNLARAIYLAGDPETANRVYFLNTSQSSCDLFYEVALPLRVHCDHPLGTIIGRGYFDPDMALVFSDGCCIGNNWGIYPEIQGNLAMMPRSAVIGATEIRGTVILARGASLIDAGIVEDCIVFGPSGETRKSLDLHKAASFFPFKLAYDQSGPATSDA